MTGEGAVASVPLSRGPRRDRELVTAVSAAGVATTMETLRPEIAEVEALVTELAGESLHLPGRAVEPWVYPRAAGEV